MRRFSDIEDHRLMNAKEIFLKEKDIRRRQMELRRASDAREIGREKAREREETV